jgi:squalene synthase HpnC
MKQAAHGEDPHAWVRRYTRGHRENFSVLSWLLPRRLRDDFAAVYAFCRWSDDLADEAASPEAARAALRAWRSQLDACFAGTPSPLPQGGAGGAGNQTHPIFIALRETIVRHRLPAEPFHHLLDAFERDQDVTRYDTYDQLLDYCRLSADPVGRLVLMLGGVREEVCFRDADATCTALQIVNHMQDVRRDVLERDRVYLPAEIARKHGLDPELLARMIRDDAGVAPPGEAGCPACKSGSAGLRSLAPAYRASLAELGDRADVLFREGRKLWPKLAPASGITRSVQAFTLGGEAILRRIRLMDFDTPRRRPSVSSAQKLAILARLSLGRRR